MGGTSAKVGLSARFELISSFALASQSSFISINRNERPMMMIENECFNCMQAVSWKVTTPENDDDPE